MSREWTEIEPLTESKHQLELLEVLLWANMTVVYPWVSCGFESPKCPLSAPCIVTDIICVCETCVSSEKGAQSLCVHITLALMNSWTCWMALTVRTGDRGHRHNLNWCRGWLLPPWDILERRGGHWGHMWTPLMGTMCELQRHWEGLWMDMWAVGALVSMHANHGDTEGDVWATGTLRGCDWTTRTWSRTCAVGTPRGHVWPTGTLQGHVWTMMILRGDNEGTHVSPGTLRGRDWGDACDLWEHYGGVYEQWGYWKATMEEQARATGTGRWTLWHVSLLATTWRWTC